MTIRRYGQSKLANVLHARELQRRHPSITATSLHPGAIATDLYIPYASTDLLAKVSIALIRPFLLDVPQGAKNQLWAATAPKDEVRKSYYWNPIASPSGGNYFYARDEKLARELWEWTETELKKQE